ncbi:phage portal protein family protein [Nocardioides soli]|uniref:DUF935 family protein n=1 Tax=Nocardioides soli TaxID=1036020 RepID=A0A7W4YZR0_9ACTN|nr:hypothetical protein [Nocardioides soli]MBB3041013.1 hypothetical protein [Nocardioides soli]
MVDTQQTPPPSPVRERGYAADKGSGWWVDLSQETTPELRWPLSIGVFDRMRRQDAQVASVLRAVQSPIIRTQWRLDGSGCDPEVTRFVAQNLGLPIVDDDPENDHRAAMRGRDRFSWDDHVRLALLMLPFGHMFFEQVYRFDESTSKFRLRKLGPRLPHTISRINVARDGGLESIEQWGSGLDLSGGVKLPVNRLVAYVLDREGGNWLGQSLLRSAYKNWLLKDRALRTWSQSIDRNGIGIPKYKGAENETDLTKGQDIAADMRAGDNSGVAVAFGADVELMGVKGTLPDIEKFVAYHDAQIARSALGHFLNLGGQTNGQVGSYNLGSVLSDTFHLALDAVADLVATVGSAHIIEDLVDINFGPTAPAPRLTYDPIGTRQTELDRVREMAGLSSDADLTKFLRSIPNQ